MASTNPTSPLLIEEYLARGDDRFLDALRSFHDPKRLASIADRWRKDHRPWARQQIVAYLDLPLDRPGHEPVVKRLFKQAEEQRDNELMGCFLVAFDRLVRRKLAKRSHYDWQTRASWDESFLKTPRDTIPKSANAPYYSPTTGQPVPVPMYLPPNARLFGYHTRYYVRRRAWRYFRRMGHQRPGDYVRAVSGALAGYRDDDLARGENLLDSWGLMHAGFFRSPVLRFTATHTVVRDGQSFADLSAAPAFPELWKAKGAAPVLLSLLTQARSRTVRVWAMQLLRRDHLANLTALSPDELLRLLDHSDDEIQQFAAELIETIEGAGKWPVATWLRLLETRNLLALETISRVMQRHVTADRLTLEQTVALACAEPVPVARLGLGFLKLRPIRTSDERQALARLADARCATLGGELAELALSILGTPEHYAVDHVSRFFDSLLVSMRQAAWKWLTETSPGWRDAALWSRLIETPYDDVRQNLVGALARRALLPSRADLSALWSSVLLAVHRGGRAKLTALRQISSAVRDEPSRLATLLPVLAVAIRSVRATEARAGLSAIVSAIDARPDLTPLVARYLPELQLPAEEVTA